ncbi:unnamed protein product [Phyllotreta striolata]|uniref:Uncharacterized protein n=1 Tax=Phyllotreta striolata TaxID=444603 RepID=A0A9N9TTF1_PHYSR|nr:unnamed protein product [Phyllotreta striolata]
MEISESCLEGLLQRKSYVVARIVDYGVNVNYLCEDTCLYGKPRVIKGVPFYRQEINQRTYFFDLPLFNKPLYSDKKSLNVYTRKGRKNILNDYLVLPEKQVCQCSDNYFLDRKLNAHIFWNCSDSCIQKDFSVLYSGIVEHWTLEFGLRFVNFIDNDTNVVMQLLEQKELCNTTVWTTNLENIYVYESDAIVEQLQENASLYLNSSHLNYTFCERESKYLKELESLLDNYKGIIILLVILLVIFLLLSIIKLCWGIFLLRKVHNLSGNELILRSFLQNLTHQKDFFHNANEDNKSRFIIKPENQNLCVSAVNEIYNQE